MDNNSIYCENCKRSKKEVQLVGSVLAYENILKPTEYIKVEITKEDNIFTTLTDDKEHINFDAITEFLCDKFGKEMAFDGIDSDEGVCYICKDCKSEDIW